MIIEPVVVQKILSSSFVLDRPKITRILNIIEERIVNSQVRYEVFLSNGKNIKLDRVDELLALDNSVKNPITSLIIRANGSSEETKTSCHLSYDNPTKNNIRLRIVSDNSKLATQLFAELEEQVERTLF